MKITFSFRCFAISLFMLPFLAMYAQDKEAVSQEILDMKLELLNSRIELFNSQLMVWETKPLELEQRLMAVNERINQLDFDPVYFNNKLLEIEKLIDAYNVALEQQAMQAVQENKGLRSLRPDSVLVALPRAAISLNPTRLAEGTLHLGYERGITPRLSLEGSAMLTYAAEEGLSGYYVRNQSLTYYNDALSSVMPYVDNNISGYGFELKLKNYLLTDQYRRQNAPVGLYAAPGFMFRRLWLSGISNYWLEDDYVEEEVTRLLNVYAISATVGWKFPLLKVLFVDVYAGGQIRLAQYDNEDGFTRYKQLENIDFSGVMPTAGIHVGILK